MTRRLDPALRVVVTHCDSFWPGGHCNARTTVETGWYRQADGTHICPTCRQAQRNHEDYFGVGR